MNYQQITSEERFIISALRKQELNQSEIALNLGRHRSSICREFQRNCCNDGDYRPSKASSRTRTRRSRSLILPTNNRHPVKRVNYATEVNHGKSSEAGQANP